MKYNFSIVIEKDGDGYYAYCPELQGCYAQGDSYEEVLENIRDVIKLHIKDRKATKEEIRQPDITSISRIEVAV